MNVTPSVFGVMFQAPTPRSNGKFNTLLAIKNLPGDFILLKSSLYKPLKGGLPKQGSCGGSLALGLVVMSVTPVEHMVFGQDVAGL